MSNEKLVQAIEELKAARAAAKAAQDEWDRIQALLNALPGVEWAKVQLASTKASLGFADDIVRQLAVDAYGVDGNKKPAEGVGIRVMTKLVYDEAVALGWAMDKRMALKLDAKAFEKIAKASQLEFVTEEEAPIATIAKEL